MHMLIMKLNVVSVIATGVVIIGDGSSIIGRAVIGVSIKYEINQNEK